MSNHHEHAKATHHQRSILRLVPQTAVVSPVVTGQSIHMNGEKTAPSSPYVLPSEREYFGALVDEIGGLQVECTLDLPLLVDPDQVMRDLISHFAHHPGKFDLFVDHPLNTAQKVDKYDSVLGGFSVVELDDTTRILKKKWHQEKGDKGLRVSKEERSQLDTGESPVEAISRLYDLSPADITYIGALYRNKLRFALIHTVSARVYTMTVDVGNLTETAQDASAPADAPIIKQIAIEYKGTHLHEIGAETTTVALKKLGKVKRDVQQLAADVSMHLTRELGIGAASESKTHWIEREL